jgi:hypothetical protein
MMQIMVQEFISNEIMDHLEGVGEKNRWYPVRIAGNVLGH